MFFRRRRVVNASSNHLSSIFFPLHALAAPDVLEETVTLSEAVHGVVALAHGTDETAEGVDVVLAGDGTAVLVNLGDRDLDGAVILGLDDAVGGAALARDVTKYPKVSRLRCKLSPMDVVFLQVDDLATVVLHFDGMGVLSC